MAAVPTGLIRADSIDLGNQLTRRKRAAELTVVHRLGHGAVDVPKMGPGKGEVPDQQRHPGGVEPR